MINWKSLYAGERSYSIPFIMLVAALLAATVLGIWLIVGR